MVLLTSLKTLLMDNGFVFQLGQKVILNAGYGMLALVPVVAIQLVPGVQKVLLNPLLVSVAH